MARTLLCAKVIRTARIISREPTIRSGLIANTDIIERVTQAFREGPGGVGKDLLREIEERAGRGM